MDDKELEELTARKERSIRRKRLMEILKLIESGDFDSSKIPQDVLFTLRGQPRAEYISPKDRDNYNSGYMHMGEMMVSSPNVR